MMIQMPRLASDGNQAPERVTIHAMAEYLDTEPYDTPAYDFLKTYPTSDGKGLSAHYLVTPSGDTLQCLSDKAIGRHAGKGLNKGNIGIEILVPGLHTYGTFLEAISVVDWAPISQWSATVKLVQWLRHAYDMKDTPPSEVVDGVRPEWLVRHSDIAPGRKLDPGAGFDWQAFRKGVAGL